MKLVDFHAHILPNADHGSNDVSTSLLQLAAAETHGVEAIVATPHFYPDRHHVEDFLSRRESSAGRLAAAYDGSIAVFMGAEVLLCEGIANLPELAQLCIAGTNVLLIEMPMNSWSRRHTSALTELRDMGKFDIVLAHVDRYPSEKMEELLEMGFKGQINAESLCQIRCRKRLRYWLEKYDIVALGSDIHGRESQAYAKFKRACALLGTEGDRLMARTEQLLECACKISDI
ncbi:MAG: CpsB/CapC family capsule biosynthesis tyrosine phosphatase [Clostridia bacterium]